MKRFLGVSAIGVLLLIGGIGAATARSAIPVVQFENQTWTSPAGKVLSDSQVREGIIAGIQSHKAGWQVENESPGKMDASILVRGKHSVKVSITYTAKNFNVVYLSSVNMDAHTGEGGVTLIHPKYNGWVGDLVRTIRDHLSRM